MVVAINWPLFGLTRRLFGVEAALWALFAFNATPYFLVLPDGFIMPDTPLLLFLVVAAGDRGNPVRSAGGKLAQARSGRSPVSRWAAPG